MNLEQSTMLGRTFLGIVTLIGVALVSTQASGATRFGAKLDINTQPANGEFGIFCDVNASRPDCSWILMQAYQCEFVTCINGHLAPNDGIIARVGIIACFPSSFALQIARANRVTKQARVVHTGPLITYRGDSQHCTRVTSQIESFPVNVQVHKNDYLSVVTQKFGFGRCSGGSNDILLFSLPLPDGGPLRIAGKGTGCFMLLEAFYND